MIGTLLQLALLFAGLSLLAFGGGTAVLPDMQRVTVGTWHLLTPAQFLDFFAISRAAPGPGSLIVVLLGQKAAGLPGALVAFLAMFGPSCALLYVAALVWHRAAHTAWRALLERALAPVAVGLTLASGLALIRGTEHSWPVYAVTALSTLAFAFTDLHPLALLSGGAVLVLLTGG
ncbi:MAG TPA: chromate transporter [Acetobacteraceae bacterium]|nr:chromate transporter [Acetobacteraceae bacterium]